MSFKEGIIRIKPGQELFLSQLPSSAFSGNFGRCTCTFMDSERPGCDIRFVHLIAILIVLYPLFPNDNF